MDPKHLGKRKNKPKQESTSWEAIGGWYHKIVGDEGHYYHQRVILPQLLPLLGLKKSKEQPAVLDLGCGQGVLARALPPQVTYTGIDIAPSLIRQAKALDRNPKHHYIVADITKPLSLEPKSFTHAISLLALQNVEHPENVLQTASSLLKPEGCLAIVLNHPCFRIPRQTSWEVDHKKKIQYRRIDAYLSPLAIPIQAHPSQRMDSPETKSFHFPLTALFHWLHKTGFVVELLEEWCSDKVSEGGAAKMENKCRAEFPLFLTLICRKRSK